MTDHPEASPSHSAIAVAHPNIALVKYWGKRDIARNLPAVGSISITLDELQAETTVAFEAGLEDDSLELDGGTDPAALPRVRSVLDGIRRAAGTELKARVTSHNNFPTAAGLASSAAGYAALVRAADAAAGSWMEASLLSGLARQGSGSAARSLFGGFVEWQLGQLEDGSDSIARPLADSDHWSLRVVIAITSSERKSIGSTQGMELSRETSPYYESWVNGQDQDLAEARDAIAGKDFQRLADVTEFSTLKMHALALASRPGLMYWNGATQEGLQVIRRMRQEGTPVFFTVDAGPQVKAICEAGAEGAVAEALAAIPGVQRTMTVGLGEGARVTTSPTTP